MRIEEKAKAYDGNYNTYIKLINRIEDVKDAIKKQNYGIAMDILCKPYPEFQIITSTEPKEGEDEKIRKALIAVLKSDFESDNTIYDISVGEIIAWLEKQGEQKSIDYNEELKKCRENPLYFFDKYVKLKLKEQTPAWSDEDEEIYNRICYLIHSAAFENYDVDEVGKELGEYAKITDWLKAIKTRCTWKPSEEQIDALEHFVRSIGESGYASPYDNNTKLLYSLLEQLKKLKGE